MVWTPLSFPENILQTAYVELSLLHFSGFFSSPALPYITSWCVGYRATLSSWQCMVYGQLTWFIIMSQFRLYSVMSKGKLHSLICSLSVALSLCCPCSQWAGFSLAEMKIGFMASKEKVCSAGADTQSVEGEWQSELVCAASLRVSSDHRGLETIEINIVSTRLVSNKTCLLIIQPGVYSAHITALRPELRGTVRNP